MQMLIHTVVSSVSRCRRLRRSFFEAFGDFRFSRPASCCIDQKLEKYLDFRDGFFVEAGANDGYFQSNTYYLEKAKGWRGVLVEPVPELYRRCCLQRDRSHVVQAALVGADYGEDSIPLHFFNAMSYVEGAFESRESEMEHRSEATKLQRFKHTYDLRVPARTLTSILLESSAPKQFDLLSLDMEGYEVQALKGFDFDQFMPKYILLEKNDAEGVGAALSGRYEVAEQFSARDYLYRAIT